MASMLFCVSLKVDQTLVVIQLEKQIWKSYFGDPGFLGAFISSVHANCWDISSYRNSLRDFFTMYHITGSYLNSPAERGEQLWKINMLFLPALWWLVPNQWHMARFILKTPGKRWMWSRSMLHFDSHIINNRRMLQISATQRVCSSQCWLVSWILTCHEAYYKSMTFGWLWSHHTGPTLTCYMDNDS